MNRSDPIGVFDSGLGGLSVVRHLRAILPGEDIVYFGDTARVPYGIKSRHTVAKFALEDAHFLLGFAPKLLLVACNTMSALALDDLARHLPVPLVGVVEPGARAAAEVAGDAPIAVLGTEATVGSGAYVRAIRAMLPQARVIQKACPLFVPIAEEGLAGDHPVVRSAVEMYLAPLRQEGVGVVVLACTHYPLLHEAIAEFLGEAVRIVECGHETARTVRGQLQAIGGLSGRAGVGSMRVFASDNPARFATIGSRFLQEGLDHVELVEPEHYITSAVAEPM